MLNDKPEIPRRAKGEVMKILALDLGTKTGFATRGISVHHGVADFSLRRGDSPGMRYIYFEQWLNRMNKMKFELVYYEQPHHRGGSATEVLLGFVTRLQAWCAVNRIEHTAVHTSTLKKQATGYGRASKHDMMVCASLISGEMIDDDNEADAVCLLAYAEDELCQIKFT